MAPLRLAGAKSGNYHREEMKKEDWYENRIRWRARKLKLEPYAWSNFLVSHELPARSILDVAGAHGTPIFIFWLNEDNWTLLTNRFLAGKCSGVLALVDLDSLDEVSTENRDGLPPNEIKKLATIISAGQDRKNFWTPAGNAHFALRNILGMFPLSPP